MQEKDSRIFYPYFYSKNFAYFALSIKAKQYGQHFLSTCRAIMLQIASCDYLLPVLAPTRATNFHVAKSRNIAYFLQHENLLRALVVIRVTNNRKLQRNIVARQVERKCCPYYLAFNYFMLNMISLLLRRSNTGNIFFQLVAQHCCNCKLRLFVARISTYARNKFSCCKK